jgi:WS/DGAT/MGAT family acyltransferase
MSTDHEQMSNVDTAWFRMERPTNLMMITAVLTFETPLEYKLFKKVVGDRFLVQKRFMQRPLQEGRHTYWETDPNFEIDRHIHRTALPGLAGKTELQELVSDLRSTPLDFSKPLWQFHLVEDYLGGSALILRVHHCYADGMALIQVLLSMTDTLVETISEEEEEQTLFERCIEPIQEFVEHTFRKFKWGQDVLEEGIEIVRHPSHALNYAKQGVGLAVEAAKLTVLSNDPKTCFKGKLGVNKCVAWSDSSSLPEIRQVSKIFQCSINDVVLSAVAGALGAYMRERGEMVEGIEIRAAVPVNLRPEGDTRDLGNEFGLVLSTLPIGIENPVARLYKVKQYMRELRDSYQALVTFGIMGVLGYGPNSLEQFALDILSKKATTVMSNVPGPQKALYMTGAKLKEVMFWVPQTGNVSMGISIISYNDRLQFGVITDERLVDDPQTIVNRFNQELEKLLWITLIESWDECPTVEQVEAIVKSLMGD